MVLHQFLALLHAPFDTYLLRFCIILAFQDFVCQLFGQVYFKRFGYHAELRKLLERLDARYNGDGNSGFAGAFYEIEVFPVVIEQLGNGIFRSGFHFLFSQ